MADIATIFVVIASVCLFILSAICIYIGCAKPPAGRNALTRRIYGRLPSDRRQRTPHRQEPHIRITRSLPSPPPPTPPPSFPDAMVIPPPPAYFSTTSPTHQRHLSIASTTSSSTEALAPLAPMTDEEVANFIFTTRRPTVQPPTFSWALHPPTTLAEQC